MAGRPIKLAVSVIAVACAAVFFGWRLLGYVEEVWGPEANPFAPRPVNAPPRPPIEIAEIVPAEGGVTLREVSYSADPGDVPGWRVRAGEYVAAGDAHAAGVAAVAPWRGSDTPLWRQPLGGQGNSSPIVVGERLLLTIADGGPTLWLACFNLENGFGMWRQPVSREPFPPRHEKTSDAASTPCSDGTRVFVAHATADAVHLSAFGLDGQLLWTTKPGPFTARWGFTCSPAWSRGLVIVGADNAQEGFLAAVDGETGKGVWRRRRPRSGDESYSSPVIVTGGALGEPFAAGEVAGAGVARAAGEASAAAGAGVARAAGEASAANAAGVRGEADAATPIVVMAGLERIEAYALRSGRTLWGTGGISHTAGATPAIADDICVAMSGFPTRAMVALRMVPDNAEPTVLWKEDRDSEIPYVPSPLTHAGRLYVVHDDGVAHCRDLATGKVVWKQRVGGTFSASPVLVNGELLCADESGRCTLLALDDGRVQHEFSLAGGCFATPIVVRDRLLIRTTAEVVAFDGAGR